MVEYDRITQEMCNAPLHVKQDANSL